MSDINHAGSDLIFELEDRPPFHQALVGAITHLLAIFVPMVTPALIVGAALQLSAETTAYLVSMAMIASGIGTWLQVNRYGIVGSGLLSIQSVNFSFVTVMIALGSSMKSDGFHEELIMSSLLGVSFVGAFLVVGSSFILPYLRRVITPTVSGIVVLMIGLSLIKVGIIDFGGGFAAKSSGTFGNYEHLGVGLLVLIVVIGFNCCSSPLLRMGGIAIGLCVGYIASLCLGMVDFSSVRNLPLITIPHPFKYGFSFSFHQFLVVGTIYLLSVLEAVGDITATAMVSRRPIQGEEYQSRLKGGVLADGLVSVIASAVGSLPLTTFAQNNGVIQMSISRTREFLADEGGGDMCRNPLALASALAKIDYYSKHGALPNASNATAHMFIINPMMGIGESLSNLFSTHPRTEERIQKLKKQAMNPKYKEKAIL